jgi:hypothetical protein
MGHPGFGSGATHPDRPTQIAGGDAGGTLTKAKADSSLLKTHLIT